MVTAPWWLLCGGYDGDPGSAAGGCGPPAQAPTRPWTRGGQAAAASVTLQHRRAFIPRLCLPSGSSAAWLLCQWPPWLAAWLGPSAAEKANLTLNISFAQQLWCLSEALWCHWVCGYRSRWRPFSQLAGGSPVEARSFTNCSATGEGLMDGRPRSPVA